MIAHVSDVMWNSDINTVPVAPSTLLSAVATMPARRAAALLGREADPMWRPSTDDISAVVSSATLPVIL